MLRFRDSFMKALDEGRYDDLVLLLANRMRLDQETISPHARASLPVDDAKASPVRSTRLTAEEIETFDIRDKGWHLIAIKAHQIGGAERFPLRGDEDDYAERLLTYQNAIVTYYGDDAQIFAAYHQDGMLVEWHFLSDFRPAPRHF
jgi:hypothetical protein